MFKNVTYLIEKARVLLLHVQQDGCFQLGLTAVTMDSNGVMADSIKTTIDIFYTASLCSIMYTLILIHIFQTQAVNVIDMKSINSSHRPDLCHTCQFKRRWVLCMIIICLLLTRYQDYTFRISHLLSLPVISNTPYSKHFSKTDLNREESDSLCRHVNFFSGSFKQCK